MATAVANVHKGRTAKRQADKAKPDVVPTGVYVERQGPAKPKKFWTLVIEAPQTKTSKEPMEFRLRRKKAYSPVHENLKVFSTDDVERLVGEFRLAITQGYVREGNVVRLKKIALGGNPFTIAAPTTPSHVDEVSPTESTEQLGVDLVLKGTKWLNSTAVDIKARGVQAKVISTAANPFARASRWSKEGKIFGLKMEGETRYPAYAFQPNGQPVPAMSEVLKVLSGMSPFAIAAWFESTSSFLGGARPRELLATDGTKVIAAAAELREGPSHG